MVAFGKKIVMLSSIVIIFWLCIAYILYTRSFQFPEENDKLSDSKSPEQEVENCKTKGQKLTSGFWQRINLLRLEIPESIKKLASIINIETNSVTIQGTKVHYIYAKPKEAKNIAVLLLHGQSFNSETWNEIGTIKTLAAFGYHPIAIDLPGYGQSPAIRNLNKSQYIDDLITALHIKKIVLVSPSMSGSFSLRYLMEHPEKLSGYIPVSPVHTNILNDNPCSKQVDNNIEVVLNEDCKRIMHHLKSNDLKLNCIKVPTLVVWGEKDRGENSAKLCLLPESHGAEIPNGRHPAYLSNPDMWHKLLYNFLNILNETETCVHSF